MLVLNLVEVDRDGGSYIRALIDRSGHCKKDGRIFFTVLPDQNFPLPEFRDCHHSVNVKRNIKGPLYQHIHASLCGFAVAEKKPRLTSRLVFDNTYLKAQA